MTSKNDLLEKMKGKKGTKKTTTESFFDEPVQKPPLTKSTPKGKGAKPKEDLFSTDLEIVDKPMEKGENKKEEKFELVTSIPKKPIETQIITKEDVKRHLEMYNYVKKAIIDKSDFAIYQTKQGSKPFIKKSGVRKFINAFGISIEFVEKKVYDLKVNGEMDTHAEVRVRAITQKGQSVEGIGIKSMKELSKPSLHNLIATAWTKAVNRAILDLVAFGEVSAEEMEGESFL